MAGCTSTGGIRREVKGIVNDLITKINDHVINSYMGFSTSTVTVAWFSFILLLVISELLRKIIEASMSSN